MANFRKRQALVNAQAFAKAMSPYPVLELGQFTPTPPEDIDGDTEASLDDIASLMASIQQRYERELSDYAALSAELEAITRRLQSLADNVWSINYVMGAP